MILTKLILSDFGLYGGYHEFDLRPRETEEELKPIILLGGKNGSGKTTILEAIRLCLYGRDALGFRVSTADYHAYILRRIHHTRRRAADEAMVAIEFEYMDNQDRGTYCIERSWKCDQTEVFEKLTVRKEGELQFGIGPEHWQEVLKSLIPLGLSDLFFFDGERIQSLADDERGGSALAIALKDLLGVNLIEQLETDLQVYLTRQSKINGLAEMHTELEDLLQEQKRLEELSRAHEQDKASIKTKKDRVQSKIEEKKGEIASQGGIFVEQRSAAEAQKQMLSSSIKETKNFLEASCADLLPFALSPTIGRAVYKQLQDEERIEREQSTQAVLRAHADMLAEKIENDELWKEIVPDSVTDSLRPLISERIRQVLLSQADAVASGSNTKIIHDLSNQERENWRRLIRTAFTTTSEEVSRHLEKLSRAQIELEQAERFLQSVPPHELLAPLIQALHALYAEEERLSAAFKEIEEKVEKRTKYELTEVERKIKKIQQILQQSLQGQVKGKLASDVRDVLSEFRQELLRLKITDLETGFTDYFNRLARKQEFVSHVIINEQNFSMTLVSRDGRYISKSQLSAGEKQIYAIALLWALRAVAARPLPVIIDTPLGRLDSNHRQNLVEYYFPNASHQVIILSTDTEIDASYFAELTPFISHAYHLEFDEEMESTKETLGYFWQSAQGKELVDAS
ncbi:MAG TPA: DNA sulfur modification protein DndD [Ktedonobacteraceae bacterium]|nr:DNA sulfur modification protein DndD [Ktedonobacteraceae bacterium]